MFLRLLPVVCLICSVATESAAEPSTAASSNMYGVAGLNTVPSARMDQPGTIKFSTGFADPFLHLSLGYQPTEDLYLGLRQSAEVSNLRDDPKRVFPGLDLKYKIFDERTFRPEVSVGLQSALGHQRMAAEYLAFSKRYNNFDFTAGFGWGRLGTQHRSPNPLDWTGSYFNKQRTLTGEKPNSPKDWFTGDTGLFAGIEYQTPWRGISLKADWTSDNSSIERSMGYKPPPSYSFGFNYQPTEDIETGIALLGKDSVMARLTFKSMPQKWPFSKGKDSSFVPTKEDKGIISLSDNFSTPFQLGRTWQKIDANTPEKNDRLEPVFFGLRGPAISIDKNDLANQQNKKGSAEEIWQHVAFDKKLHNTTGLEKYLPFLTLRENFSLGEDDATILHRTDAIATLDHQWATNFLSETSLRLNLFSSLDALRDRPTSDHPVRGDLDSFSTRKIALERAFVQGFKSFTPEWHISGSVGYLEELFAGYHGEILYRPWKRNWAAGLEAAHVYKRDYLTPFNMGLTQDAFTTAQANFYYEIPNTEMTFHANAGRFLAGDIGGTLGLSERFHNGAQIEAYITATNERETDIYAGYANYTSGIKFKLPLGSIKHVPDGSGVELNAGSIGRNKGQALNISHRLYDMTEPLSYRHLTQNWSDITK